MKIFDKIKNLFKKKEERKIENLEEEVNKLNSELVKEESKQDYPICASCGMPIYPEQRIKTFNNKKFHSKPCFRNLMKEAKKEAFQ